MSRWHCLRPNLPARDVSRRVSICYPGFRKGGRYKRQADGGPKRASGPGGQRKKPAASPKRSMAFTVPRLRLRGKQRVRKAMASTVPPRVNSVVRPRFRLRGKQRVRPPRVVRPQLRVRGKMSPVAVELSELLQHISDNIDGLLVETNPGPIADQPAAVARYLSPSPIRLSPARARVGQLCSMAAAMANRPVFSTPPRANGHGQLATRRLNRQPIFRCERQPRRFPLTAANLVRHDLAFRDQPTCEWQGCQRVAAKTCEMPKCAMRTCAKHSVRRALFVFCRLCGD